MLALKKTSISVFGDSKESHSENLDVVEFKIKHHLENSYSFVEALVYPVIYSDITLANLEDRNERFLVGVLIGVDFYHKFFLEKIIKSPKGPVASS